MNTAPDLFAHAGIPAPLPQSLEFRLDDLARKAALWPVPPGQWRAIVADVRRFAVRWHYPAPSRRGAICLRWGRLGLPQAGATMCSPSTATPSRCGRALAPR
jgi:hypothetical protein